MSETLIVIPAREQASRLPRKPLADIAGAPMIVHVWRRAVESKAGRVIVATDSQEICEVIERVGGEALLTRDDHHCGTDRVFEAVSRLEFSNAIDYVVNLQGDLPTLQPEFVNNCLAPLNDDAVDIATLAAEIVEEGEREDPNVVKVVGSPVGAPGILRAIYFTRSTAPHGSGPLYHHIGIYAYRRAALEKFVVLPPSTLELRERLEQLRAIEAGMRIDVALVDTIPLGVDTPADLERARALLASDEN